MAMAASDLLTIREYGDRTGDDDVFPFLDADARPLLEPGETTLLEFWADVSGFQREGGAWVRGWGPLPAAALVTVTDRRVVFVCDRFTKGSTWAGFGVVGLAVATTATAVSASKARKVRKGRAAAGQVRYDWLAGLAPAGTDDAPAWQLTVAHPLAPLALRVGTHRGQRRLDNDLLAYVGSVAAHFRLATVEVEPPDEAVLRRIVETDNAAPADRGRLIGWPGVCRCLDVWTLGRPWSGQGMLSRRMASSRRVVRSRASHSPPTKRCAGRRRTRPPRTGTRSWWDAQSRGTPLVERYALGGVHRRLRGRGAGRGSNLRASRSRPPPSPTTSHGSGHPPTRPPRTGTRTRGEGFGGSPLVEWAWLGGVHRQLAGLSNREAHPPSGGAGGPWQRLRSWNG